MLYSLVDVGSCCCSARLMCVLGVPLLFLSHTDTATEWLVVATPEFEGRTEGDGAGGDHNVDIGWEDDVECTWRRDTTLLFDLRSMLVQLAVAHIHRDRVTVLQSLQIYHSKTKQYTAMFRSDGDKMYLYITRFNGNATLKPAEPAAEGVHWQPVPEVRAARRDCHWQRNGCWYA